jgi:SAM-dependent methyltransferase
MAQTAFSLVKALAAYPVYLARDLREFLVTIRRYYPNARFRGADLRCLGAYLLRNPDDICRRYLRHFPDDEVQKIYGETFFTTLDEIAGALGLTDRDVVYDLGCGRGRGVFWLNAIHGCRAVGVEINPAFVMTARRIQKKAGIGGVEFILGSVMDVDYNDASVIYLYGTAFSDEAVMRLVERFKHLRAGTRIVTVSYALKGYAEAGLFQLEQKLRGKFLWGEADIYIQRKL